MSKFTAVVTSILVCAILRPSPVCSAQSSQTSALPEKVIIDTDIGDDIDDAFAVALALRSPELQILGITTTFGDTETRAKLLDRFLAEAGRPEIPVAAGVPTPPKGTFTQRRYAENNRLAKPAHPHPAPSLLVQLPRNPAQVTLPPLAPPPTGAGPTATPPAPF